MRKSTILGLQKDTEQQMKRRAFPWVLFMMIMNLTLGRAKKKNQRSNRRGSLSPVQSLSVRNHHLRTVKPVSASHPPVPTNDIQPCMSSCGAEQAFCYKFHRIFHSFYEPVNEYMEWHFLHALEPPYFISTSAFGEKLKDVTVLLSRLHHLLVITDRVKSFHSGSYLIGYGGNFLSPSTM
jgi:hypothetical protein